ncbi:MAG: hypothetical protein K2G30_06405 [Muribaculaceae bacterium]|nr:hypothetical protein [Muribaculaceae bacterium]
MKWNEVKGTLGIMGCVLAVMATGGGAAFFYANTLVEWWLPLVVALCAALLFWVLMKGAWARWWPGAYGWLRCVAHFAIFAPLAAFVLLGANYAGADDATLHGERVEVERKYREKHYRNRRVGRNRYVKGEPYYTYKVEVRFADGRLKTLDYPLERYNCVRQGAPLTLEMEAGLLGWPVIRR